MCERKAHIRSVRKITIHGYYADDKICVACTLHILLGGNQNILWALLPCKTILFISRNANLIQSLNKSYININFSLKTHVEVKTRLLAFKCILMNTNTAHGFVAIHILNIKWWQHHIS